MILQDRGQRFQLEVHFIKGTNYYHIMSNTFSYNEKIYIFNVVRDHSHKMQYKNSSAISKIELLIILVRRSRNI